MDLHIQILKLTIGQSIIAFSVFFAYYLTVCFCLGSATDIAICMDEAEDISSWTNDMMRRIQKFREEINQEDAFTVKLRKLKEEIYQEDDFTGRLRKLKEEIDNKYATQESESPEENEGIKKLQEIENLREINIAEFNHSLKQCHKRDLEITWTFLKVKEINLLDKHHNQLMLLGAFHCGLALVGGAIVYKVLC